MSKKPPHSSILDRQNSAINHSASLATAWMLTGKELDQQYFAFKPQENIWLGTYSFEDKYGKMVNAFGYEDDKAIVTIAGSRAGKGTSAIIPTLLSYTGSVFVLDPKGENAKLTVERRGEGNAKIQGMGQKVAVLDPFNASEVDKKYKASFNPLSVIKNDNNAIGMSDSIANSLITVSENADPHWHENAQAILQALILHVKSSKFIYDKDKNLIKVRHLLTGGDPDRKANFLKKFNRQLAELELELESPDDPENCDVDAITQEIENLQSAIAGCEKKSPFDHLIDAMTSNKAFGGIIARWAESYKNTAPNERAGFITSAKTNTKFLEEPKMQRVLETTTFQLEELRDPNKPFSLYLCLPIGELADHGRWLRTLLIQTIKTFERMGTTPAGQRPTLFLLDEFMALGHMPIIEQSAGLMAGFGVKFWFIVQDLSQLKRHYSKSWETFLANAGLIQAFSVVDLETTQYLSNRIGKIEIEREMRSYSSGKSTSQGTSSSSGTSTSRGTSSGSGTSTNTGSSMGANQGYAPGTNFHGDPSQASNTGNPSASFVDTGASSGSSSGAGASYNSGASSGSGTNSSSGTSSGTGSSEGESSSLNYAQANLVPPDEIAKVFSAENQNQLLLINGFYPLILERRNYYEFSMFQLLAGMEHINWENDPHTLLLKRDVARRKEKEAQERQLEFDNLHHQMQKDFNNKCQIDMENIISERTKKTIKFLYPASIILSVIILTTLVSIRSLDGINIAYFLLPFALLGRAFYLEYDLKKGLKDTALLEKEYNNSSLKRWRDNNNYEKGIISTKVFNQLKERHYNTSIKEAKKLKYWRFSI
ncbi:MAG: type IV secretory system conjugative DNA transfer family protein [Cycloclasticus sp.]|nr:type IV secretory system conjugative DNA transfer family protein [Cycloclasticus sp.]